MGPFGKLFPGNFQEFLEQHLQLFSWDFYLSLKLLFSLNELSSFIVTADQGLTKPVNEGDYDGLVECMGYLMAVKDRSQSTDAMFEPLKQSIELLKSYEQELSEETHALLQVEIFFHLLESKYFTKAIGIDFFGELVEVSGRLRIMFHI